MMEEALTVEDPSLSLLLGSPAEPRRAWPCLRCLLHAYVVLSVLLFLPGAGATDPRLQGFGALMLLAAPIARPWIADLKRPGSPFSRPQDVTERSPRY